MSFKALVVGGTGGIGFAIASRLAAESPSSTIIISGRHQPTTLPHANMTFRALDASSMRSIRQFTDTYQAEPKSLDMLVLSQGILTTAGRTETPGGEGIDYKMALHYYGRMLLVRELLPVLKDDATVLTVLDGVRGGDASKLIWDDLDLKHYYSIANAANHCITMTDAMVQGFAAQQKTANTSKAFVHALPGFVNTNISQSLPWYLRTATKTLGQIFGVSPDQCAETLLRGTKECVAEGRTAGRLWSCLDSKGHLVANKPVWKPEDIQRVEEHTWKVIDEALAKGAPSEGK